jgi:hypothetical protein
LILECLENSHPIGNNKIKDGINAKKNENNKGQTSNIVALALQMLYCSIEREKPHSQEFRENSLTIADFIIALTVIAS